jgi:hypothetical protein
MADGLVVRSGSAVVQDLPDGSERGRRVGANGWALLCMHVESRDRVPVGTYLHAGDPIGHPSCEGGRALGTHVHIARKYNGEWVEVGGTPPFVLSGWVVYPGEKPYEGTLVQNGQTVEAHHYGSAITKISIPINP